MKLYNTLLLLSFFRHVAASECSNQQKCTFCSQETCGSECYSALLDNTFIGDCYYRKVHGGWTNWGIWGSCSAVCGYAERIRHRSCSNPSPSYQGNYCFGKNKQTGYCDFNPYCKDCDIQLSERVYDTGETSNWNCLAANYCFEKDQGAKSQCYRKSIHGNWSPWQQWSECTSSCGYGIRQRERACTNPTPMYRGTGCHGDKVETSICDFNPFCEGCEILPQNRNYLHIDKHTLTHNSCKRLGYCWDKETFPDGIDCYMKQFPTSRYFEEKTSQRLLANIHRRFIERVSKIQCILKCKNSKRCTTAGFITLSNEQPNVGTCFLLEENDLTSMPTSSQYSNYEPLIIFSTVEPWK